MSTTVYPPTQVDWPTQVKRKPTQGLGYVVTATTSPMLIPETSHLQGPNITVDAWSGALVQGHITGNKVYAQCNLNPLGTGDVTVIWGGSDVGSVIISSVAYPYVASAGASPLVITAATHGQGNNVAVDCWSGPVVNGAITGTKTYPQVQIDGAGNVTITWYGGDVQSVMVSGSVNPLPYTANATVSPQTIPAQVHLQGPNVSVECWSGILASPNYINGTKVMAQPSMAVSGNGNVTVAWGGFDVGCFIISASGPSTSAGPAGPAGPVGPVGPPGTTSSFITAATTSPQTISAVTHGQGANANVICYDGPVVAGVCTGNVVNAGISKDSVGNFTVAWGGTTVESIQVKN